MKVLTGIEIAAVLKELNNIINSKVARIYQPNKAEIVISFHKVNEGKLMLRVVQGQCLYLTSHKQESPREQFSFCKFLRKRLHNTKLLSIHQRGFERITEFEFQAKEEKLILIVEFFSKGNIILCKEDYTILSALEVQLWKDRQVKAGEKYKYPPHREFNLSFSFEDFKKIIDNSDKESIVKALAIDFGFGGVYSEELCKRSNIEKSKKKLEEEEARKLFAAINEMAKIEINANSTEDDVFPFSMETKEKVQEFKTYNEALSHFYSRFEEKEEKESHEDVYKKKISEQEKILSSQAQQLENIQKSIGENKGKGDLIYKNYAYIKELLETIKKARDKKLSWEEISAKLKTKGIEVNQKEGKVTVELT